MVVLEAVARVPAAEAAGSLAGHMPLRERDEEMRRIEECWEEEEWVA